MSNEQELQQQDDRPFNEITQEEKDLFVLHNIMTYLASSKYSTEQFFWVQEADKYIKRELDRLGPIAKKARDDYIASKGKGNGSKT